jgi:hypothetical protein
MTVVVPALKLNDAGPITVVVLPVTSTLTETSLAGTTRVAWLGFVRSVITLEVLA